METAMKRLAIVLAFGLLAAALMPAGAGAQQTRGKIYAWCLEQACGLGGSCQTLCRFENYQQCRASWTPGDRCIQNFYKQRP
jgi:hypothetical protein